MMKKLRYLFSTFLLLLVAGVTWAAEETVTFSSQGYSNGQAIETYTGTNFSIAFNKGSNSNAPTYYTNGTAIRAYGSNTFTVTSEANITKIVITFGSSDGSNAITADVGTYSNGTWTGSANSVTFTIGGTKGNRRIASIAVTTESANPDVVGKPIFTVNGTTYAGSTGNNYVYDGDQLEITCDNADKIYYTTNGNSPLLDASGNPNEYTYEYTSPITISSTQTVFYAIGRKNSGTTGEVAGVVFLIKEPVVTTGSGTAEDPYTVADALALLADGQTPPGVYVKGIVSQVDEVSPQHGNATYWISDDGTTDNQMEAYRGKYLENANFTSEDQIQVGDEVVVTGNIVLYGNNKIPEFSQGNYLYSLTRNTPEVAKYYLHYGVGNDWDDAEFTYNNEAGTYTATLPVVNGTEFKVKYGLESASEFTWYGGDKGNEPTCRIHDEWYKDIPLITPGDNFEIQLSEPTTLTFTLTANPTGAPTLTVTGWPEPKYYLHYGTGNDWSDAEFTYNDEAGTYTATLPVVDGTEFKVKYGLESASEFTWYGGDKGNEPTCRIHDEWYKDIPLITPGDNFEIQLSEPTTLTFTLDPDALTLTVTGWPQEESNSTIYKRVTSSNEIVAGKKYILVTTTLPTYNVSGSSYTYTKYIAMGAPKGDSGTAANQRSGIAVDVTNNMVDIANLNVSVLTAEAATSGMAFKTSDNDKYLGIVATKNQVSASDDPVAWTITDDFNLTIADGNDTRTVAFNVNSSSVDNADGKGIYAAYKTLNATTIAGYLFVQTDEELAETIDVTIGETGYATLYYSDMNLVVPEGVTATTYKVAEGSLTESKTYEPNDVIPAATGVVLYTVKPATYSFTITSQDGEADADNMLQGTDAATTISEAGYKYYILSKSKDGQKIGFYYQDEDGSAVNNGAHKAYLPVPEAAAGGAKGWSFDGEATGIRSIEAGAGVENAVIYNLSGVRMNSQNLPKGIYIVNGKKMVVK